MFTIMKQMFNLYDNIDALIIYILVIIFINICFGITSDGSYCNTKQLFYYPNISIKLICFIFLDLEFWYTFVHISFIQHTCACIYRHYW